jgi:S1-C subfamily serine protease
MLDKWKRAVIHLECATDSVNIFDRVKLIEEQVGLLREGKITREQFAEKISGGSRDIRFHGTALILSHNGRRYLLTARHVVCDEQSAEHTRPVFLERATEHIFNIIFRVPSLDEVIAKHPKHEFLMNLGAGTSFTNRYTFSTPEIDLAVISLDQRDAPFADELEACGFVPVTSDDIADGPDAEGQDVFTIGFPESTSVIGRISHLPAAAHWSSSNFSLPVSSFGRVSMLHDELPFFWADMSIYPGNSGGPVVANDQLVGIVSGQAILPIDDVPDVGTRIPFGYIIKSIFVRELLATQEDKDRHAPARGKPTR